MNEQRIEELIEEALERATQTGAVTTEILKQVRADLAEIKSQLKDVKPQRKKYPHHKRAIHRTVLYHYLQGKDPVSKTQLLTPDGHEIPGIMQIDHYFRNPLDNRLEVTWPVSAETNEKLKNEHFRRECYPRFLMYQELLNIHLGINPLNKSHNHPMLLHHNNNPIRPTQTTLLPLFES